MSYRSDLELARVDCRRAFFEQHPVYQSLDRVGVDSIAALALSIQRDATLTTLQFYLMASFVRSSAVSFDLIAASELTEGVTVLRKQVELVARLTELDTIPPGDLFGKTPNVGVLPLKLRRFYGAYSAAAHSSAPGQLALLGFFRDRVRVHHPIFPEFTENTGLVFQHWMGVLSAFTIWAGAFRRARALPNDASEEECERLMLAYLESGEMGRLAALRNGESPPSDGANMDSETTPR